MALIKSISGIRGTIGGKPGDTLSPIDVVRFTAAYGTWMKTQTAALNDGQKNKVVIGRDGRISGELVQRLVVSTLNALGIDVIDLGLSTTPTVEMAVVFEKATGGIILTASHNPKEWNALKLLNHKGEFISGADGATILDIAAAEDFEFSGVDELGNYSVNNEALNQHIDLVVNYPLVDKDAIQAADFNIVLDAINSTGATAVPALLKALGVEKVLVLNAEVNGQFAHNPEPLPEHLNQLCNEVNRQNADLGIAVDPDVDRLCFVCEDGSLFGEEYTLVAVADYILQHRKGNTVSNLSSTRALKDVTEKNGGEYYPSAVGLGPIGGITLASGVNVGWNMFMRGVANSFDKPETTLKLIGLIEKGNDKNLLKFLLKQANIYSYNIIKNDVGGSKEYLKETGKETKDWLLEPQTVPWNER